MSKLPRRRRIGFKGELALALMPTVIVLLALALVEALTRQRLLFASLASSAFLIYLDPENAVNKVRTLVLSQLGSAAIGLACFELLGTGYLSGGIAMIAAIVVMIAFDVMHPPAVSTALSFGLRAADESNLMLFALAVGITALLIVMQRTALWILRRLNVAYSASRSDTDTASNLDDVCRRELARMRELACFDLDRRVDDAKTFV